jgi:esterase/lipase superfamily enzyme
MIIVTNRNLVKNPKRPEDTFGKNFSGVNPSDLRLAKASYSDGKWKVEVVDNEFAADGGEKKFASEHLFQELQQKMREQEKNCLFFVHGYNNDFEDVLERGRQFEENYGVEVIIFTWPADGDGRGGFLNKAKGTALYLRDKREASMSNFALDKVIEKLRFYFSKYDKESEQCQQKISILFHSMGNYLFENLVRSSEYAGETLLFDNVIMVAADVNNHKHEDWVSKIKYRKRLYIFINEEDKALRFSQLKPGKEQKVRLGNFTKNLSSKNAVYIDVTKETRVNDSHAYFEKPVVTENKQLGEVFKKMVNGEEVEDDLVYKSHNNSFVL